MYILVYLWLHVSSLRGVSDSIHRSTPFQCWRFRFNVFAYSRWGRSRCFRGMFIPLPVHTDIEIHPSIAKYLYIFNPRYERAIEKYAPYPVPPEFRLEMGMVGAPLFAISFFWFA